MYAFTQAVIQALLLNTNITNITATTADGTEAIYPNHITSASNPLFPAISMGRQGGGTDGEQIGSDFVFQIDVWSKSNQGTPGYTEIWNIYREVKKTIEVSNLITPKYTYLSTSAKTAGVFIMSCIESYVNDDLYEADTRTYHLSAKYRVKAIDLT